MVEIPQYIWVAKFRDGHVLKQIEGETVHYFNTEVLPFASDLLEFWIEDSNGKKYGMNLLTGDFFFDGGPSLSYFGIKMAKHVDVEFPIDTPLRPIFFRRTTRTFNCQTGDQVGAKFVYAIGWQATVEIPVLNEGDKQWHTEKRNVKHILYVHDTGELVFG